MKIFGWFTLFAAAYLVSAVDVLAADFNGDGKQDIVWRLPSGNPLIWEMNGLAIQAPKTMSIAPDAGSSIVGTGKLFSSGPDAIVWVDSMHRVDIWQVDANGNLAQACAVATGIDASWNFLALGDVDGNGIDDVLWRLPDGSIKAFLMNGCSQPVTLALQSAASSSWVFAGTGDIDGDHRDDLIWLDANASHVIIWQLGAAGAVTAATLPTGSQIGWQIGAVADFDGDGKADILWRQPTTGEIVLWSMNGTTYTASTVTATPNQIPDSIFNNGFDTTSLSIPLVAAPEFSILAASDFNGDGRSDLLLGNTNGQIVILLMLGATVQASASIAQSDDMPLTGLTGWRLPPDRPSIVKVSNQVTVSWTSLAGSPAPQYTVYASAENSPAETGVAIPTAASPLSFARNAAGYSDKRYFSVSATYHGIALPASPEAYIVEFAPSNVGVWGAMAIGDINRDGCVEMLGISGDCNGHFATLSEATLGLGALRAPGREYRDVRFADFNGDGILDAIANVYSCDAAGCGADDTNSQILLFLGKADGTFSEDTQFTALNIPGGGFGETIVIADFNNDGYLDIFLPKYTFYDASEHNFLLINDGHGNFTDKADAAGIAMHNVSIYYRPEGAQALDLNGDGWIDIYAGSYLFINNGNGTFTNVGSTINDTGVTAGSPWGLPAQFDEGAKFIDWDNSGNLSLALNTVYGIRIFKYDGAQHFTEQAVIPPLYMNASFGLTATDIDGDGRTDLVVAGGYDQSIETNPAFASLKQELDEAATNSIALAYKTFGLEVDEALEHDNAEHDVPDDTTAPDALPQLLLNRGQFVLHDFFDDGLTPTARGWNDLQTFADFDYNGTSDIVSRFGPTTLQPDGYQMVLMNQARSHDVIVVSVLGANGEQNQMGRVVRVTPDARPSVTMTQVVDSGSGYMGNGPYDLTFATPYPGAYKITIRFATGTFTTTARAGHHVTMYANGTVSYQ